MCNFWLPFLHNSFTCFPNVKVGTYQSRHIHLVNERSGKRLAGLWLDFQFYNFLISWMNQYFSEIIVEGTLSKAVINSFIF